MERRDFLQAGLAFGAAAGIGAGVSLVPEMARAAVRRSGGPLRLNSNENPLGLPQAARRAILDGLAEANRYPRESRIELVGALAALHRVEPENIVLGNGSTEVLQMSVQALAQENARLVLADPTFEDVPWYGQPFPYRLEKVPLDGRHAHDIGRMKERAEGGGRAIVYICNPNNPTGTVTPSSEVDEWIESADENTYFLVDEAYYEYCVDPGYWSCTKWVTKPNVIVARTFSKIYGMAGMRLGYAVAHKEAAARLSEYIAKTNANHLVLVAARVCLDDAELVPASLEANSRAMRILYDVLEELDLEYLPSQANFVMHRINSDLATYGRRMLESGVRVGRPFPPMLGYNRLSIGLPEEMERFAEILREFRKKGWT
ncbi:MAG: aminotransferase class I/II-fold pyridoxal phosphate-dependent enzyme [Gemmatimonadota bacterium]|nr:MAG: aminotransferase class I/II-fold pyridoxal phosphate-dependent enzyme [Gemmatimonadota bacterium]